MDGENELASQEENPVANPVAKQRKVARGYKRTFKFKYTDLAKLLDMTPAAARKAAQRGRFDPNSLQSIFEFAASRGLVSAPTPQPVNNAAEDVRKHLRNAAETMLMAMKEVAVAIEATIEAEGKKPPVESLAPSMLAKLVNKKTGTDP
jgi:hypothetical protein